MVRGLIIRQAFILLDIALAVLAVVVAGLVLVQILTPPERIEVTGENPQDTQAQAAGIAQIGELAAYGGIVGAKLFGVADVVPPPVEGEGEGEGGLPPPPNLKLIGTIALSPKDPFATAFIENTDEKGAGGQAYGLGEEVIEKIKLVEVRQREAILLSERDSPPTRSKLTMDEPEGESTEPTVKAAAPPKSSASGTVELDRQELVQDLYANYADLVTRVKPRLVTDSSGKVSGITADDIGEIPMAQKLGLSDGDVLQTVNNEQIDSEQKILEIVQKYRNASSFRIGIMRDGKPQVITYRLN